MYTHISRDIRITVQPYYLDDQSSPSEDHYVWAYHVKIENVGQRPVQLLNRHWRITDALGRIQEVRGAGVVGEQPVIDPGESFEYTSGTPLPTPSGIMVGSYEMEDEGGERFDVQVPAFSLDSPHQPVQLTTPRDPGPVSHNRTSRPDAAAPRAGAASSTTAEAKGEPPAARSDGRPPLEEVEAAVRTLLRWTGDDPDREGLLDTPGRVARAFEDWFSGYFEDPVEILERTFEEVEGYDEMVVLRDVRVESHCEHHMAPILGHAHLAYMPDKRVVGISKMARIVELYAKRLQIQEKLTAQIANAIQDVLQPRGVAVVLECEHQCMTTRGVHKPGVTMVTSRMLGMFRKNDATRREFLSLIGHSGASVHHG